jgi:hypothetical protein
MEVWRHSQCHRPLDRRRPLPHRYLSRRPVASAEHGPAPADGPRRAAPLLLSSSFLSPPSYHRPPSSFLRPLSFGL